MGGWVGFRGLGSWGRGEGVVGFFASHGQAGKCCIEAGNYWYRLSPMFCWRFRLYVVLVLLVWVCHLSRNSSSKYLAAAVRNEA